MRPQEAIILAAGSGRRLGEATRGTPKCLVEIGGRSILERQVSAFTQLGVQRFVLVSGYRASEVERAAREICGQADLEVVHNERYAETNVLTSWILGSRRLAGDHFYAHADTVFAPELLGRLVELGTAPINLTYDSHECGEEEMKIRLEANQLVEISKTMPSDSAAGEFTGVMSIQGEVLSEFREVAESLLRTDAGDSLFVEAALQQLLRRGRRDLFSLVDISGVAWREVDFPEDLSAADAMFRDM